MPHLERKEEPAEKFDFSKLARGWFGWRLQCKKVKNGKTDGWLAGAQSAPEVHLKPERLGKV